MGRQGIRGGYSLAWEPPEYSVDDKGKRIGYVNENQPNNWGRWGEEDQKGTTNFITPEVVSSAGALIKTGRTVSCAIPLNSEGPVHPMRDGVVHMHRNTGADFFVGVPGGQGMIQGSDDFIMMPLQGSTQWDGLAHIFFDDVMYNGFWMGNVNSLTGVERNSIDQQKETLVGRGVLLDVARQKGVDRLEPGVAITPEDLDATAAAQGVELHSGDIVLIRTGHVPWFYELADKAEFWAVGSPGLGNESVQWIHDHEIAAVALDNIATEVEPSEPTSPQGIIYPLHIRLIRDLGLTIGEVWWLDDLAKACEDEGRWEFFLSAPPLNATASSGSPINPIAVF